MVKGGPGSTGPPFRASTLVGVERVVERAAARLSRPVAATIGVLAVWAALGVGHLVAGLLSAASSPFLAVGDAVVRLSPQSVTEFAKNT